MKYLLLTIILIGFISCTSSTPYGKCIGAFDAKDPTKVYKLEPLNIIIAIAFIEIIVPTVYVIADQTFCPIGNAELEHKTCPLNIKNSCQ